MFCLPRTRVLKSLGMNRRLITYKVLSVAVSVTLEFTLGL